MGTQAGRAGDMGLGSSFHYVLSRVRGAFFFSLAWLWYQADLSLVFFLLEGLEERFSTVLQGKSTNV